jgi:membrane-associated phospholipid phosphatase
LGRTSASWLAAHAIFLLATAWCARHPARPAPAGGRAGLALLAPWLPLLLVPPLYTELPHVAAGLGLAMHDARVIGWELALFGESPARAFAAHAPWRWLSETLHAGYLSYYAVIYGPPLLLFARRRAVGERPFAECAFTVMLAFVCCYAVFVCFPVQGPWFQWPAPPVPAGPVRHAVERLLHAGSSRGTAFPSSHVAVSVAQTLVTLRHARWAGAACAVCTVALALGAMYGGLHYGIDVVVGAVVGTAVGTLGPRAFRAAA